MYAFIINAAAGGGRAAKVRPTIERFMAATGLEFSITETGSPREATDLAHEVAGAGRIPVAAGGDGSIHHVFRGVVAAGESVTSTPRLGILPVGTGNDLARMLNISPVIEDALTQLIGGAERSIDYGWVDWEGTSEMRRRPFINVSGIGLDAQSALLAVKLKPYVGNLCYTLAPALSVWTWKRPVAEVRLEDVAGAASHWSGGCFLASVANGKWVGGGITISPEAEVDDGLLDLCLIRAAGSVRAINILARALNGRHTGMKEVDSRKFRSMEISMSRPSPIHTDGEPCTTDAIRARFSVARRGIRIVGAGPT